MLDLSLPLYHHYVELLSELRRDRTAWERVAFTAKETEERGVYDGNELERGRFVCMLWLDAGPGDVELVRFLLDAEIAARQSDDFQGAGDTLYRLSILLLELGDETDAIRFWRAKRANFDTWAGGHDHEFVAACLPPDADIAAVLADSGDPRARDVDWTAVRAGLPQWRAALTRFARTLDGQSAAELEAWAELFDDWTAVERIGLAIHTSHEARARLYGRLKRFGEASAEWLAAAADTKTVWDEVSRLRDCLRDAARASIARIDVAERMFRLRDRDESLQRTNLGRWCVEVCFEAAMIETREAEGKRLFSMAETWRRELRLHASIDGVSEIAIRAAERWGTDEDIARLRHDREQRRAARSRGT